MSGHSERIFEESRLLIAVKPWGESGGWEVDVYIDGEEAGGGTSGTVSGALDVAMDILYGDTNDHLNDDFGALERAGLK